MVVEEFITNQLIDSFANDSSVESTAQHRRLDNRDRQKVTAKMLKWALCCVRVGGN